MPNMHRIKASIASMLWGVAVLCLASGASANEREDSENWHFEGLAGTWRVQVTTYNCKTGVTNPPFSSFLTFDAAGTLTGTTANAVFYPASAVPTMAFGSGWAGIISPPPAKRSSSSRRRPHHLHHRWCGACNVSSKVSS